MFNRVLVPVKHLLSNIAGLRRVVFLILLVHTIKCLALFQVSLQTQWHVVKCCTWNVLFTEIDSLYVNALMITNSLTVRLHFSWTIYSFMFKLFKKPLSQLSEYHNKSEFQNIFPSLPRSQFFDIKDVIFHLWIPNSVILRYIQYIHMRAPTTCAKRQSCDYHICPNFITLSFHFTLNAAKIQNLLFEIQYNW